jgi:hypothetical protein
VIVRTDQTKRALLVRQRLAIPLVGHQDRFGAELRVHFAQREYHLVAVTGLGEHITGECLATQLLAQGRTGFP